MDQACPEQVELCAPIALAFDQLEAGDLALNLATAPGQRQGCTHGLLVLLLLAASVRDTARDVNGSCHDHRSVLY